MVWCEVLNADGHTSSWASATRALWLCIIGEAEVVQELPGHSIRTVRESFPTPVRIRLIKWRKLGPNYYKPAPLTQRNLFLRDGYRCAYCGRHVSDLRRSESPTRDHLVPLSAGGKDEWRNVVLACSKCNHHKDNRSLTEFARVLQDEITQAERTLAKTRNEKSRNGLEQRLAYLATCINACKNLEANRPIAPTVSDMMGLRRRKHAQAL